MQTTITVIIGAGQAGLALSHELTGAGHDHVVLERGRVGERWRSERWDSLRLLTPNWMNRLPGSRRHADPDGYLSGSEFVEHLAQYAGSFGAPVAEGTTVLGVERLGHGFRVRTDDAEWLCRNVVIATGHADLPRVPGQAEAAPAHVEQLHASRYRSPGTLPAGGVLIVGAGPSGQQIAAELRRAGRPVVLAVGSHHRTPRRYRGRDIFHWLCGSGHLYAAIEDVPNPAAAKASPSLPLTGARGGEQLDLGTLHEAGVVVTGRLAGFSGRHALFADDLRQSMRKADQRLQRLLDKFERHLAQGPAGPPGPAEPVAPLRLPDAPTTMDLSAEGIRTVVWATGYRRAYPWLHLPVTDAAGDIEQHHGVTRMPGLYTLGMRFQHRRKSHYIGGVGEDAAAIAGRLLATGLRHGGRRPHATARPTTRRGIPHRPDRPPTLEPAAASLEGRR